MGVSPLLDAAELRQEIEAIDADLARANATDPVCAERLAEFRAILHRQRAERVDRLAEIE